MRGACRWTDSRADLIRTELVSGEAIAEPNGFAGLEIRRFEAPERGSTNACADGGRNRCRSGDLTLFRRALYQLSYPTVVKLKRRSHWKRRLADLTGFEPAASGLTGRRALLAAPQVRAAGHEPSTEKRGPTPSLLHYAVSVRPPSSSGLGRCPFTAVTRVRIPLGVLQLVIVPGIQADSPRSEPYSASKSAGSSSKVPELCGSSELSNSSNRFRPSPPARPITISSSTPLSQL